jgi:hypothetical protein
MEDTTKIALAAAAAGGYILGRAKKGRLAFSLITYAAGRRFGLDPRELATQGLKKLAEMPQVAELGDQIKGEALDAGRKALVATANRRMADLADSLHERTLALEQGSEDDAEEEYEEAEGDYEEEPYEDEWAEEEEPEEEETGSAEPSAEEEPEEDLGENDEEEQDEAGEEEAPPARRRTARRSASASPSKTTRRRAPAR